MTGQKNFLHQEFDLSAGDVVEVTLTGNAANVLLLDATNYEAYRQGRPYRFYGGYARTSPVRIAPLFPGHYHLVVDLGGGAGSVQASGSVIREAAS